ncbi:MAG: hypothetical protein ACQGVK_25760 [Myxococcota bacterium]
MRRICLVLVGVLYVLSIPWYRDASDRVDLVFGLPDWVAVALGCYVAVAVLNALAWWRTEVEDALPGEGAPDPPSSDRPGGAP